MALEKFDLENLTKDRIKTMAKTLRTIDTEELKKIGDEIFHFADDPWRDAFFKFISEHPGSTFHYATTSDGVNILYSRDDDTGIWFLPGSGMGLLQTSGKQVMKEMIEGRH
jgi:hypothetical protein